MPLMRHIAGVPTPTEQRCVRCCEVIATRESGKLPTWPGDEARTGVVMVIKGALIQGECQPVDMNARGHMRIIDDVWGTVTMEVELL